MKDHFENSNHSHEGEKLSPEQELFKKELNHRVSVLRTIAKTYEIAETEESIQVIKELIDSGELEKADKQLSRAEKRAQEIQEEKRRHPHEGKKESLFHHVGYLLAKLREKQTLNIEILAQQSGIEASRIEAIEKGEADNVTLNELYKLAQALGVDITVEFKERYNNI